MRLRLSIVFALVAAFCAAGSAYPIVGVPTAGAVISTGSVAILDAGVLRLPGGCLTFSVKSFFTSPDMRKIHGQSVRYRRFAHT